MSPAKKTLIALGLGHALLECFSGVWPIYKHLAHLDLRTAGLLAAITTFISQALQPAFGHWADKGYERAMFLVGVALTFLLMLIGPVANIFQNTIVVYTVLASLMLLSRMGHSMFHPAAVTLAGQTLKEKQGTALGIFISMGWLGIAASQASFSFVYLNFSGHSELLLIPAALLLIWIAAWCKPVQLIKAGHRTDSSEIPRYLGLSPRSRPALCRHGHDHRVEQRDCFHVPGISGDTRLHRLDSQRRRDGILSDRHRARGGHAGGYLSERIGAYAALVVAMIVNMLAFQAFLMLPPVSGAVFIAACTVAGILTGTAQPLPIAICQRLLPRNASLVGGILMGWTWAIGGGGAPLLVANLAAIPALGILGSLQISGLVNVIGLGCAVALVLTERRPAPAAISIASTPSPKVASASGRLVEERAV